MTLRRGALLGFGNVAEHGHLPAWRERTDVRLVAVAEPSPERAALAQRALPDANVYEKALDLLAAEKVDFVDIAAPPVWHLPLTVAAAAAGCHVLCEKPLATTEEAYRGMAEAARTAGVTLFTVHNWRQSPHFRRVRELLLDGAVGRVRSIRFETIRNGQAVTVGPDWRGRASLAGGGILVDHGWHLFYLLRDLAGTRPTSVSATTERRRYRDSDVEDTVTCRIAFPASSAVLFLTWAGEERRTRWQVEGDGGVLVVDEDRLSIRSGRGDTAERFERSLSAGSHHPDWFAPVIDAFFDEIEGRRPPGENLREAEGCLRLLTAAYASEARGGEPVPIAGASGEAG